MQGSVLPNQEKDEKTKKRKVNRTSKLLVITSTSCSQNVHVGRHSSVVSHDAQTSPISQEVDCSGSGSCLGAEGPDARAGGAECVSYFPKGTILRGGQSHPRMHADRDFKDTRTGSVHFKTWLRLYPTRPARPPASSALFVPRRRVYAPSIFLYIQPPSHSILICRRSPERRVVLHRRSQLAQIQDVSSYAFSPLTQCSKPRLPSSSFVTVRSAVPGIVSTQYSILHHPPRNLQEQPLMLVGITALLFLLRDSRTCGCRAHFYCAPAPPIELLTLLHIILKSCDYSIKYAVFLCQTPPGCAAPEPYMAWDGRIKCNLVQSMTAI
ncbi:hypothetical protein IF1G_05705 [Cordyceps javanica]|uniref:Uncharacterized protein n=1 Tax=Cordyceps javanica TaxID=43265 RepID=A0A545V2D5_9HYPO|nr:hypothetical protein IF1G_05705 [Cordyceps javanica]